MARRSRKAEQLKQELLSTVQQQELITQPVTFAYLNGEMSVMQARIQTVIMEKLQLRIAKFLKEKAKDGFAGESVFRRRLRAPERRGGQRKLPDVYREVFRARRGPVQLSFRVGRGKSHAGFSGL